MGVGGMIGSEVMRPVGRIVAVDHAGRTRSIEGGGGSYCRVAERRYRHSNQLDPPSDLRPRNGHDRFTDVVSVRPVSSNEMIVLEINFAKQTVTGRTRVYSVVHGNSS